MSENNNIGDFEEVQTSLLPVVIHTTNENIPNNWVILLSISAIIIFLLLVMAIMAIDEIAKRQDGVSNKNKRKRKNRKLLDRRFRI